MTNKLLNVLGIIKVIVGITTLGAIVFFCFGGFSLIAAGEGYVLPEWMVLSLKFFCYVMLAVIVGLSVTAIGVCIYGIFRFFEYRAYSIARKMLPKYRRNWHRFEFVSRVIANCIGLLFVVVIKGFKLIGECIDFVFYVW